MWILQKLRDLIERDLFRAELDIECEHSLEPCPGCRNDARAARW